MLKCNSYVEYITSSVQKEVKDQYFSDVILVSDELVPFKAHKFILASRSPVFKEMLLTNLHSEQPTIFLKGISSQEL